MNRGCERSGSLIPANVPGALPHRYGAVYADSSILSNNVRPRLPSVRTRCADLNFDPMHLSPPCHPPEPHHADTETPARGRHRHPRRSKQSCFEPGPCNMWGSCAKARTWTYRPDNVRTDPEVSFALLSSTRPRPGPPDTHIVLHAMRKIPPLVAREPWKGWPADRRGVLAVQRRRRWEERCLTMMGGRKES